MRRGDDRPRACLGALPLKDRRHQLGVFAIEVDEVPEAGGHERTVELDGLLRDGGELLDQAFDRLRRRASLTSTQNLEDDQGPMERGGLHLRAGHREEGPEAGCLGRLLLLEFGHACDERTVPCRESRIRVDGGLEVALGITSSRDDDRVLEPAHLSFVRLERVRQTEVAVAKVAFLRLLRMGTDVLVEHRHA